MKKIVIQKESFFSFLSTFPQNLFALFKDRLNLYHIQYQPA